MKTNRIVLFLLAMVLLLTFSVFPLVTTAQESTEEPLVTNTPAVTEAPTVEPTAQPEPTAEPTPTSPPVNVPQLLTSVFNLLALGIGFFAVGTFGIAGLLLFLSRKDVQDQLENAYKSADPDTQDRIRAGYERGDEVLKSAVDLLGKLSVIIDRVTDGKANEPDGVAS